MTDIKNCPFCGGSAQIVEGVRGSYLIHYVKCDACQAIGEKFENKCSKGEESIAAWNKRAESDKYAKLLNFLKKEIALRKHVCTTNHAVLLDNAAKLLKDIGE